MFIAFSFGAFIEGAAGFGAPVAVSGAMLAGLGFDPFYAAGICLLANTAPVAFGSIGIPVITLANVTGLPVLSLSAMVGRLCAMISVFIPGYLIVVMAGRKRALEVLPAIVACGVSFAGMQFFVSNYVGPELTDILSSLTCIVVMVAVLKFWKPKNIMRLEGDDASDRSPIAASTGRELFAGVAAVSAARRLRAGVGRADDQERRSTRWTNSLLPASLPEERDDAERPERARAAQPDHAHAAGDRRARRRTRAVFTFNWLSASGHRLPPRDAGGGAACCASGRRSVAKAYTRHVQAAVATRCSRSRRMLGLAYLMNYSGMTSTLGLALAATGTAFPFFSAVVGWLGVFLTGSDTSANALFGNLQVVTANALQPESDPDGVGQLRRGRDGQDDFGPEHRRRRRGDRHDVGRREPPVPLHHQAQRPAHDRDGAAVDALRLCRPALGARDAGQVTALH